MVSPTATPRFPFSEGKDGPRRWGRRTGPRVLNAAPGPSTDVRADHTRLSSLPSAEGRAFAVELPWNLQETRQKRESAGEPSEGGNRAGRTIV